MLVLLLLLCSFGQWCWSYYFIKNVEKEKGYCQHSQKNKSEPLIIYDPTMIQPLPTALLMANAVRCGKAQKCWKQFRWMRSEKNGEEKKKRKKAKGKRKSYLTLRRPSLHLRQLARRAWPCSAKQTQGVDDLRRKGIQISTVKWGRAEMEREE